MGSSFIAYTLFIALIYVIYAVLAIRILVKDITINKKEKVVWTILFLIFPIISVFIYYILKNQKIIDRN